MIPIQDIEQAQSIMELERQCNELHRSVSRLRQHIKIVNAKAQSRVDDMTIEEIVMGEQGEEHGY